MKPEIALMITLVIATFIITVAVSFMIAVDAFTDDERNQLPHCYAATEVLVGSGDFNHGHWATYACTDISTFK